MSLLLLLPVDLAARVREVARLQGMTGEQRTSRAIR
jgi:hypothetical protein